MTILLGILVMGLLLTLFYFCILPFFIYIVERLTEGRSKLCFPHNHHEPVFIYLGILFFLVSVFLLFLFIGISYELGKYIQENIIFL
jgi:hypothetical protein